ncbi:MAG: CHAP domain-containing protein [Phenylobacterium sp.]|uniref:CHAP domain-containing protein n=1 Tax=Phenylobacterium sp. TaxID=1871053 RepID=UPI001B513689|nr:CHAP domain-containing protein [Phenylobacterium sp.]MBP7648742.1 CHAP domain-containing protein [Phenylobacterium sp.]MBP7818106.1 CHAP domain-containing protein [Phenylobacterium sp.]MBP9231262.1 CHAP domain-containing protein [Phenylobacterium sp.]
MSKRTRTVLGSLAAAAVMTLAPVGAVADTYWQCVPFARLISGVQIFGDAWTWWKQAAGKYETGFSPKSGAVLCFKPNGKMQLGHVAVVSQVLTDRVIQITHANWSRIGGTRGQVEKDVTVIDVSPAGDWSQVKVWYDPVRDLGSTTYPTYGFIYQDDKAQRVASSGLNAAGNTAIAMAQGAANQMASAVRPGAGPFSMLSQAADSTDKIAALILAATQGSSEAK